jgi:hypothetical protein
MHIYIGSNLRVIGFLWPMDEAQLLDLHMEVTMFRFEVHP